MINAQLDTSNLQVQAVQESFDGSSGIESSLIIGLVLVILIAYTVSIFVYMLAQNSKLAREEKIGIVEIIKVTRNIAFSLIFFAVTFILIGLFYAF